MNLLMNKISTVIKSSNSPKVKKQLKKKITLEDLKQPAKPLEQNLLQKEKQVPKPETKKTEIKKEETIKINEYITLQDNNIKIDEIADVDLKDLPSADPDNTVGDITESFKRITPIEPEKSKCLSRDKSDNTIE